MAVIQPISPLQNKYKIDPNMKQRNVAIDILKGIGIILVLTAHALEGFVSQFAYTFHMPLFFIVTGLLISVFTTTEGDGFTT